MYFLILSEIRNNFISEFIVCKNERTSNVLFLSSNLMMKSDRLLRSYFIHTSGMIYRLCCTSYEGLIIISSII